MAPTVHSPQGFAISKLLVFCFMALGLSHGVSWWLAFALIPPVCWVAHWIFDMFPHYEFIMTSTLDQFLKALEGDPKIRIKVVGLRPVFQRDGRERLDPSLAHPKALYIFTGAMRAGMIDVLVAVGFALWLASLHPNQPEVALLGLWGAMWAVMPDLILFKPFWERTINSRFFWSLDYLHHFIHCRVMAYDMRWIGLTNQLAAMVLMLYLAVVPVERWLGFLR